MPKLLQDGTPAPTRLLFLWDAFWSLAASRREAGFNGIAAITQQDLMAWMHNRRFQLRDAEQDMIFALDRLYRKVMMDKES